MVEKIRLELSDWLYNAGIVGLANIFEENEVGYDRGINYIEFDASVLDGFEEMYFKYFINKYEKFTSWYKIVSFQDYIEKFDIANISEKDLEIINNQIEDMKKKLTSNSYKSAYLIIENTSMDLLKEEKKLQKIKMNKKQGIGDIKETINQQIQKIKEIISYFKMPEVKRVIVAKNVIYDIIQNFWADVSFLNKNNSQKDMYKEYKNYFLNSVKDYVEEDKCKNRYGCYTCDNKISKLSKPSAYDLTWLNKIGVDMSRKTSHFWNFYGDSFICPICNLVYSCIPAGFTVIRDRGLFVNQNSNVESLIKINKHTLEKTTTFEDLEQESYFNIVENISQNQVEQFDKEIENIQIVKFDGKNQRRPYSFNILSKNKLKVIYDNKNMLKALVKIHIKISSKEYMNLYREAIQRFYDGKNLFDLINKLMVLNLDQKFNKINLITMLIKINNSFIGGRDKNKMIYYKDIDNFKDLGLKLREAYNKKNAVNKLGGITYRLLNSLKTKNQATFMDTLINSYMYLGKQIPTGFINGLKDIDKFQTIGYSFLVGLQGDENKEVKEEVVNE